VDKPTRPDADTWVSPYLRRPLRPLAEVLVKRADPALRSPRGDERGIAKQHRDNLAATMTTAPTGERGRQDRAD
jgi:hypothetical protein